MDNTKIRIAKEKIRAYQLQYPEAKRVEVKDASDNLVGYRLNHFGAVIAEAYWDADNMFVFGD